MFGFSILLLFSESKFMADFSILLLLLMLLLLLLSILLFLFLGDVAHVSLELLGNFPAGDRIRADNPGELEVWVDDPAICRILELVVLDVGPDSPRDVGPAEPLLQDDLLPVSSKV